MSIRLVCSLAGYWRERDIEREREKRIKTERERRRGGRHLMRGRLQVSVRRQHTHTSV